jgi:hypothetical protein
MRDISLLQEVACSVRAVNLEAVCGTAVSRHEPLRPHTHRAMDYSFSTTFEPLADLLNRAKSNALKIDSDSTCYKQDDPRTAGNVPTD